MTRSYAETYALCCANTIEDVQKRLGRDLTAQERRRFWNVGSLMMYDIVYQSLTAAQTTAELEQVLLSMEKWTEERFQDIQAIVLKCLPEWLGRAATDAESAALARCEHIGVFESLAEQLKKAPPDCREAIFREFVAPLMP